MNSSHFSNLLKQLLSEHNIVALPGMGYFEMKDIPSEIINNGTKIKAAIINITNIIP